MSVMLPRPAGNDNYPATIKRRRLPGVDDPTTLRVRASALTGRAGGAPRPTQDSSEREGWRHVDKIDFSSLPPRTAYVAQKQEAARTRPHVFRHTYRALATSAGASEIAIRLLIGHNLRGDVSFDYLIADLDWLPRAQGSISDYILTAAGMVGSFAFDERAFR